MGSGQKTKERAPKEAVGNAVVLTTSATALTRRKEDMFEAYGATVRWSRSPVFSVQWMLVKKSTTSTSTTPSAC